jgi:hypothetical protein
MASAADDMQRRSRALAAGRPMGREGKTFPKIFQKCRSNPCGITKTPINKGIVSNVVEQW